MTPDGTNRTTRDAELLTQFVAAQDEHAFAELIDRHGGLVFSTCRRILGQTQDAEDAAQAVFLILARKACRLDAGVPLEAWLYHVAVQTALNTRKSVQRQSRLVQKARTMGRQDVSANEASAAEQSELRALVDQEIDGLPAKYRQVVVLHHLKGKTKQQTADILGEKEGTISMRLSRGRDLLKQRLAHRGMVFSIASLAALGGDVVAAEIPAGFTTITAKGAVAVVTGAPIQGLVSEQVAQIMTDALAAQTLKLNIAAIFLSVVLAAGGATLIYRTGGSAPPPKFLVAEQMPPEVLATLGKYQAGISHTLYQGGVDPDNDGNFNSEALAAWPTQGQPPIPADFAGIIVLDWQGKMMDRLHARDASALNEYVKAVRAIKKRWPSAKVAGNGIPLFSYWVPPEGRRISTAADYADLAKFTKPITDAFDLLCQPLYDFYAGNDENDSIYFSERVKICTLVRPDAPIAVLIAARYHDAGSPKPTRTIPKAEVTSTIKLALQHGADHIIQWGSESDLINYANAFSRVTSDHPNYSAYKTAHATLQAELPAGWTAERYRQWSQRRIIAIIGAAVNGKESTEYGDIPK